MEVICRKIHEQRGEISLRLCFILLGAILLFLVVFNVRHAYQTIDLVIDRTNEAVLAVAAANGYRTFGGVREGEAVARNYNGASWSRTVTTEEVLYALGSSLNATISGDSLIREGYRIDHLSTSYVNADGNALHFVTNMDITIFLLGGTALTVGRHLEVKTTYEAKF